MAVGTAQELAGIPMSANLAATLSRAAEYASAQFHREVSLEHLLLSLTEDADAGIVLTASNVDLAGLKGDISNHLGHVEDRFGPDEAPSPSLAANLVSVLKAAAAAAQGRRSEIDGAIVLAAVVGDGNSTAANLLSAHGLTFEEAIRVLKTKLQEQPAPPAEQAAPAPVVEPEPAPAADQVEKPEPDPHRQKRGPESTADILAGARERVRNRVGGGPSHAEPHAAPAQNSADDVDMTPQPGAAPVSQQSPGGPQPGAATLERAPPSPGPQPQSPAPAQQPWAPGGAQPQPSQAPLRRRPMPRPQPQQRPAGPPAGSPRPQPAGAPVPAGAPWGDNRPAPMPAPDNVFANNAPQQRARRPMPPEGASPVALERAPVRHAPPPGTPGQQPHARPKQPGAAVQVGQLVENIPRRMRVAIPATVEARIAQADVKALAEGLQGGGTAYQHKVMVTKAMSVRLRAPDGGFFIETASPETQWIENNLGLMSDDFASWRWNVTPKQRGKKRLQLIVSARTIGPDGLAAETALPDKVIEVRVRTNYGRSAGRWFGWIAAAIAGGLLARFGEGFFDAGKQLIEKVIAGG